MTEPVTVLLVEDNPDDEELTVETLRDQGVVNEIRVAHDGQEALDCLLGDGATSELPKLVMLDLKLPKVDGLEVLRRLRQDERTKLLPVAILTSSAEENDLVEGYSNGANCYVRKPVDFEEFCEVARTMGLFWLLINQPPPARA
jgi:two-component system, response regulator